MPTYPIRITTFFFRKGSHLLAVVSLTEWFGGGGARVSRVVVNGEDAEEEKQRILMDVVL